MPARPGDCRTNPWVLGRWQGRGLIWGKKWPPWCMALSWRVVCTVLVQIQRVTAAVPLSIAGWCMHTSFLIARYADWAPVCTPSPSGGGLGWGPAALASSASVPSASRPPSQPSPRGGRGKTPHQISVRCYQNCCEDAICLMGWGGSGRQIDVLQRAGAAVFVQVHAAGAHRAQAAVIGVAQGKFTLPSCE